VSSGENEASATSSDARPGESLAPTPEQTAALPEIAELDGIPLESFAEVLRFEAAWDLSRVYTNTL
jgi:hypothetical protein